MLACNLQHELTALVARRSCSPADMKDIFDAVYRPTAIVLADGLAGFHIPDHESPRTTKLYDRTSDEITLDEVERILI